GGDDREPALARHVDAAMSFVLGRLPGVFRSDFFRVLLLVPERVAGVDARDHVVIVLRRWIGKRPLERATVPGIATGPLTLEEGVDHDPEVDRDADAENDGADGRDEVGE